MAEETSEAPSEDPKAKAEAAKEEAKKSKAEARQRKEGAKLEREKAKHAQKESDLHMGAADSLESGGQHSNKFLAGLVASVLIIGVALVYLYYRGYLNF